MREIILASKSPRRKELLENIGVKFQILVSDVDESVVSKDLFLEIRLQHITGHKKMLISMLKKSTDTVTILESMQIQIVV